MRDRDFHRAPDRPGQGRQLLRAGADAGPADPGPAPQGPEERPVGAAQAHHPQHPQHDDQAALVPGHARHPAPPVRQHRGPRQGRGQHGLAVRMDRQAVRPGAVVGRRGVDQEALGRQADPQGHPGRRGRAAGRRQRRRCPHRLQPRRPPARRRAFLHLRPAGDRRCGGQAHRSAHGRRHPLGPARAQGRRAGRQGHLHRPRHALRAGRDGRGRRGARACRSSTRSWTCRWPSAGTPTSTRWTRASCCPAPAESALPTVRPLSGAARSSGTRTAPACRRRSSSKATRTASP